MKTLKYAGITILGVKQLINQRDEQKENSVEVDKYSSYSSYFCQIVDSDRKSSITIRKKGESSLRKSLGVIKGV